MTLAGGVEDGRRVAHDVERHGQVDAEHLQHRRDVVVGEAVADHRVHRDEEEHREQGGQAAAGRVDAALLVELLGRRLLLHAVALVLALDLLDLRLEHLRPLRGDHLLPRERRHQQLDDDRQQDDRDGDVAAHQRVQQHQRDEQDLEDRREGPGQEVHGVGAGAGRRQRRLGVAGGGSGRAAAGGGGTRHACRDDQGDDDQEQERRQPDEELLEAGHAIVLVSVSGPGHSRPGSRDGTGRGALRPSSDPRSSPYFWIACSV